MSRLTDPRLMSCLKANHFPSVCTIQAFVTTETAAHQPVLGSPYNVRGMVNIPCRIAPLIELRPADTEVRTGLIQERRMERQCKLSGYFPAIQTRTMQAVVDGVAYPITGVECDSERLSTRLKLEVVEP